MIPSTCIPHDEYRAQVAEVAGDILEILSAHCGPNAAYAAWASLDPTQTQTDTEFSKDGVTIVRSHLRYDQPIHEQVRFSCAYLGTKVDSACNDGTTTAMMVLAGLLKGMVDADFLTRFPYHRVQDSLERILSLLDESISDFSMDLKDYLALLEDESLTEADALRDIVYWQSMISSKGNRELSSVLTEYASLVPFTDLYGQYTVDHDVYETQNRIYLKHHEHDIGVPSYFVTRELLNTNLNSEYKTETADLLVVDEDLMTGSPFHERFMAEISRTIAYLEDTPQEDGTPFEPCTNFLRGATDLVIFVKSRGDEHILTYIQRLNRALRAKGYPGQVALIQLQEPTSLSEFFFLTAIRALAGQEVLSINEAIQSREIGEFVIPSVSIHSYGRWTRVGKLYDKTDGVWTPHYHSQETRPLYTALLTEVVQDIERYLAGHSENEETLKKIPNLLLIYRHLVCQNWVTVCAGGKTHDVRAAISVIQDAFGAANASATRGFVFGGYVRMLMRLYRAREDGVSGLDKEISDVFIDALKTVLHVTYGDKSVTVQPEEIQDLSRDPVYHHVYDIRTDVISTVHLPELQAGRSDTEFLALVQPTDGFRELIVRLRELLPKFALTRHWFDQGGG